MTDPRRRARVGPGVRGVPPERPTLGTRPAAARRYLLDSETLQFAVRRHWAVLATAGSGYVAVLVLAVALLVVAGGSGAVQVVAAAVLVVATGWFGWRLGDWWVERFTVTDRRVLLVSGLLTRRVAIMPLRKVTDLTYERTLTGRMLGFGAFVMESAGQHQALSRVDFLPEPDRLYQEMSDLLFGSGRADWDPDEDGRGPGGPDRPPAGRSRPPGAAPSTRATALTEPLPEIAREPGAVRVPRGRVPRNRRQP